MAANKAVWGVDLGQCALKAIKLVPGENGVEVVDYVFIEHAKILSQPDVDRNALIEEAMKKLLDQHDLTRENVVVGVPGQHTLARFSKLPPVDKKKIPEIVQYEAQQQIPFDMDEVIWDYQTFTTGEGETEVGIFAMRRELLRNHLHFVGNFNLEPAAVQSGPLALYNALKYDGLIGSEPIAILDIGTQNADLIVAEGGTLWTRNIPIGGNAFTDALSKTFKVSFRKAENLKRDAAKSKYARQIFQAMRPVFADLVAEIQRSIGFFTSSRRGVRLNKLIAMGAAFKLPGLQKFLQQNLGMDVIRPSTFSKVNASGAPNAPQLVDQMMSFGVAYGLALQGLGLAAITSNLLPPEIASQVVWRKKVPWFYGAAACLVLSSLIVWGRDMADAGAISKAKAQSSPPSFQIKYDENDKLQENPKPDEAALNIISNGPAGSTQVERAKSVIAAAQHAAEVVGKIETSNDTRIADAKQVAELHAQKTVWPAILRMVHTALPRDSELNDAMRKGPDAFKKLVESGSETLARPKRKQIFIKSFSAQYSPDVVGEYRQQRQARSKAPTTVNPTAMPAEAAAPAGEPLGGFIVVLKGRTPNAEGYEFIKKSFQSNLEKAKDKEAYVAEESPGKPAVYLIDCYQIGKGDQRTEAAPGGPLGGLDPGGPVGGGRKGPANVDAVTGEPVATDYAFEIIMAVVVGEKPAAAPAGGAQ
jgi:type IV pilus assembly protein PilM